MSDAPAPKGNSTPDTHDGVAFTVPEKSIDVRVTEHSSGTSSSNHEKELFDVGRAFSGDTVQKGTIVSDRKRAHTGVGTMLASAWNEWWGNTRKSLETSIQKLESHPLMKPKDEPTLSAPHTRSSVIEEAHAHGVQAPRDDHAQVREKIRSEGVTNAVPLPTFAIKTAGSKTSPSWVSTRDPVSVTPKPAVPPPLDLRSGATQQPPSSNRTDTLSTPQIPLTRKETTLDLSRGTPSTPLSISPEKRKVTPPTLEWSHMKEEKSGDAEKRIPDIPKPAQVAVQEKPLPTPPPPHESVTVRGERPVVPTPITIATPLTPTKELPKEKAVVFPISSPEKISTPAPTRSTLEEGMSNTPFNAQSIFLRIPKFILLGIVVIIGSTAGILVALTSNTATPDRAVSESTESSTESPLTILKATPLAFSTEPHTLLISLATFRERGGESHEVVELIHPEREGEAVTASEFMGVIGKSIPAQFGRSLTHAYGVGVLREGVDAPFIVLSSPAYERAFGGMLVWEKTMSADLSPFFGAPVTSSLTPGKELPTANAYFVDAIVGNGAVRILYDEFGNERIVYALVDDEYILITSTTEALASLITLLK